MSNASNLYVFDATCLIDLERRALLRVLSRLADRICIPTKVKTEVNKPRTPLEKWFAENPQVVKWFVPGSPEEEVYYRLTIQGGSQLGDGEAAALAMAANRGAVLITDDKAARRAAVGLGVTCITTEEFLAIPLL